MERINTKPENQLLFSIRNKQGKFGVAEQMFLKELLKSGEEFTKFISELSQPNSIFISVSKTCILMIAQDTSYF
ncbi:hypothetical protein M1D49_14880 [Bacillus sp. PK3-056]|uniref:hypothetical protein n=1 Tax=Niallia circulans TaxID=1397 RepID=UPI000F449BE0|nr:hypothetical protein [Niallia circulans]AYV70985.1 hypothetical protein C2H98_05035 [Niallia circulans]